MQLKGSKTEQHLKDAFAGESQANRRYLYFASKADVEGYNDVAGFHSKVSLFWFDQLYSLEQYARNRPEFRARVMAHKEKRRLPVGPHATLYFEDRLTMHYQVQEMLRLERLFEAEGIQDELDVYNPLIPDGGNWKATFMVEYEDETERRAAPARLIGIEKAVWVRVKGFDKVKPIANEDLERETEDSTAAVHFLRFELTPEMVAAVRQGAGVRAGIDHPVYREEVDMPPQVRDSLASDLSEG